MTLLIAQGGAVDCLAPCLCLAPSLILSLSPFSLLSSPSRCLSACWPRNLLCDNSCVLSAASASATPSSVSLSLPPPILPSALPASHLGNSPLNAHCRLMKDLCGAINMKSCCEMRFHLNVIKHTMSLPHTALPLYLPLSPSLSVSLSLTHSLFLLAAGGPESSFSAASTSQGEYPLRYYQKKGDKLKKKRTLIGHGRRWAGCRKDVS